MPKKTEKKAAAATATAGKKRAAKLEIELISAPESKPKAKKTSAKKPDAVQEPPANAKKSAVKSAPKPPAVSNQTAAEPASPPAKKKRSSTKTRLAAGKTAKVTIKGKTGAPADGPVPSSAPLLDPIGDVSDGEAHHVQEADLPSTRGESEALAEALAQEIKSNEEPHYIPQAPRAADSATPSKLAETPAKLERLQKILSQAGVASRRRAEEMIVEGRVMVNGQVVTQLGAKADAGRDHIRVDGKLLTGAERHRYFILNKPRGYVTTVSDPEGRPTVMQFFEQMHQRLYPVGRLDYLSEGLLLVTNDGDLANQLTRASLGVEKTYLVKVAGNPTEEELDRLRSGVSIERGAPGTERVGTAPAAIRQVRQGDNPWYEVVLIEGRNRELRKMFEQIGHFVEKIRRVGYGPLVLDVEPGKIRELTAEEVKALQLTAEGKLKPRRQRALPTVPNDADRAKGARPPRSGGKTFGNRPPAGRSARPFDGPRGRKPDSRPAFDNRKPERGAKPAFRPEFKPRPAVKPQFDNRSAERFGGRAQFSGSEGAQRGGSRPFDSRQGQSRPFPNSNRGRDESDSGRVQRFEGRNTGFRHQQRNQEPEGEGFRRREFAPRGDKPAFNRGDRPEFKRADRPAFRAGGKPEFRRSDRPAFKPGGQGEGNRAGQSRFKSERPAFDRGAKPPFERSSPPAFDRGSKPPFKRDDRPPFKRTDEAGRTFEGRPSRPPGRSFSARPAGKPPGRPSGAKFSGKPSSGRKFGSSAPRKSGSRPGGSFKPRGDRKRY